MSTHALGEPYKIERDQWLAIELRHFAALATVAQQASFSGAADSLGYVQSAVSQQIGSLERIVGRRLVDRSARPRSVALTPAGKTLLDHVDEILEQLRLAKADIDALDQESAQAVSFGIDATFGSWLAGILFGALLPGVGGGGWDRVERGSSADLLRLVADGQLAAAFVGLPIASGPFFALELARQPYVLAVPAAAATATATVDTILERWPLVHIHGCPATATLQERFPHRGACATAANGATSALALVRGGAAVAVMTAADVADGSPSTAKIPLPELPERVVGLAWHREHDDAPAVERLRAVAQHAFGRSDRRH